jgi:hypothetical protein
MESSETNPPQIQFFMVQQLFNEKHIPLSSQQQNFNPNYQLAQIGAEQLHINLINMLTNERQVNPSINPLHHSTFREHTAYSIVQFGLQINCLDQTILQAIQLADHYLCNNL